MTTHVHQTAVLTDFSERVGKTPVNQAFHLLSCRVPELGAMSTRVFPMPGKSAQEVSR